MSRAASFSSMLSNVSRMAIWRTMAPYSSQLPPKIETIARRPFSWNGLAYLALPVLNISRMFARVSGEDRRGVRGGGEGIPPGL